MKKTLLILTALLFIICLWSCSGGAEDFEIYAEDVTGVPAGEYTLLYSIPGYEKYKNDYNLGLTVNVYDESNRTMAVQNNRTVKLESDNTYTVIIRLSGNYRGRKISSFKQFTVTTRRKAVTVKLVLKDGDVTKSYKSIELEEGERLYMDDMPEVPRFYAAANDLIGHSRTIVDKYWSMESNGEYKALTQEMLDAISEDTTIYSYYVYSDKLIEYTVSFESNGGTTFPDQTGTINDLFVRPPTRPTREGYLFLGWCVDEELTTYYNWSKQKTYEKDMTLYAKWTADNAATATADGYFSFEEKIDNEGNPYFKLSAKDKNRLPTELVLPNSHAGVPVRELTQSAFSGTGVTSVYVPSTYTLTLAQAFSSCKKLTKVVFEGDNLRENLDMRAFFDCTALQSVTLSDNLKTLDEGCFWGCVSLTDVTLPSSLVLINENAFRDCKSLTEVTVPSSVQYLQASCFAGCSALSRLTVPADSELRMVASSALNDTDVSAIFLPASLKDNVYLENINIVVFYHEE